MIVFGKQQISYQSKEKLDEQDSERERERERERLKLCQTTQPKICD